MMSYKSKKVLITGASAGIGMEFARQFHRGGAELVLVARRKERLEQLCSEFNQSRADSARYIVADLAQHETDAGFQELIELIESDTPDILVNNAGRGSFGSFEELDINDELAMMHLNALAPMKLTSAALPAMKERRSGAIINIASIAGLQPLPYMATYAATKAVNLFHSLALHFELKKFGVHTLAVCPGPVGTEFAGVARVPGEFTGLPRDTAEDCVRDALAAFNARRAWVIPCLRAKLLAWPSRILPFFLTTALSAKALSRSLERKHLATNTKSAPS